MRKREKRRGKQRKDTRGGFREEVIFKEGLRKTN